MRVDEHGSYIRSSVQLISLEPGLTEIGQRRPHRGHLQLIAEIFVTTCNGGLGLVQAGSTMGQMG
jgi:hypothetical protein